MDSLPIVKVDAQMAPSKPVVAQSAVAGDKQATEKKSFSEALTKTKNDTQQNKTANSSADVDNSSAAKLSDEEASTAESQEFSETDIKELNPLLFNHTLLNDGQKLPPVDVSAEKSLPIVKSAQLNQHVVSQATREAVPPATVALNTQSEKASPITAAVPLSNPATTVRVGTPAINEAGSMKRGLKSLTLSGNEKSSLITPHLLSQSQQSLLQKAILEVGMDGEALEKTVKLLSGNDIARSEVNSAGRTVDSSLNVGLSADPLKTANENLVRTTQAPKINLPLSDSNWGQELSHRISWMSKNNIQSAQIKITPAHLGPIEVRVSLQNDQAAVSFVSNHAVVREAIESASARLRESFSEEGFDKVDVDVSSQEDRQKQQKMEQDATAPQFYSDTNNEELSSDNDLLEHNQSDVDWTDNIHQVDYFA